MIAKNYNLPVKSKVANIKFEAVNGTGEETTDLVGTLRFGFTDHVNSSSVAWAYGPSTNAEGGDIWMRSLDPNSNNYAINSNYTQGTGFGFATLLHEIGHSLGLQHSFEVPTLPAEFENTKYSIMSYTSDDGSGGDFSSAFDGGNYVISSTPMVLDIAAIQHLYGEAINDPTDQYTYDAGTPFAETIWDTGGVDTLDFSSFTTNLVIDLTPGASSTIPTDGWILVDNLALAKPTTNYTLADIGIENVAVGSGDDQITGNDLANEFIFKGSFGHDVITGFQMGTDKISILKDDGNPYLASDITPSTDGNVLKLELASNTITLIGFDGSDYNYSTIIA